MAERETSLPAWGHHVVRVPSVTGVAIPELRLSLDHIGDFAKAVTAPPPQRLLGDGEDWKSMPFVHASSDGPSVAIRGLNAWFAGHVHEMPAGGPDGIFAAWAADERGVTLRNDRYGFYPIYFYSSEQEFIASPSVLAILACGAPRELDDEGLSVFLRLGYFIQDQTPFKHIHAIPPDCRLRWSPGSLRVSGEKLHASQRDIDRSAAIDAYIDLVAQAVTRCATSRDDLILPLSGGRDSRHLLFELLRQGRPPRYCITAQHFPPRPNDDVTVASAVARAAGTAHVIVKQPSSLMRAEAVKNGRTGFCTEEHVQYLPIVSAIARDGGGQIFDGIGGDVLSGELAGTGERLKLFSAGRREDVVGTFLHAKREAMLAAMLTPEANRRFGRGIALEAMRMEFQRHTDEPNPVGSFIFWNRTRRAIALAPYSLYAGIGDVVAPYVDRDLFDFVTSLPGAMLEDQRFHTEAIARAYPQYAHLPYAPGWGTGSRQERWFNRRHAAGIMLQMIRQGPSMFVRRGYLGPRLAKRLWDGTNQLNAYQPLLIQYLLQLERAALKVPGSLQPRWTASG